jgi:hypothetical protein
MSAFVVVGSWECVLICDVLWGCGAASLGPANLPPGRGPRRRRRRRRAGATGPALIPSGDRGGWTPSAKLLLRGQVPTPRCCTRCIGTITM